MREASERRKRASTPTIRRSGLPSVCPFIGTSPIAHVQLLGANRTKATQAMSTLFQKGRSRVDADSELASSAVAVPSAKFVTNSQAPE